MIDILQFSLLVAIAKEVIVTRYHQLFAGSEDAASPATNHDSSDSYHLQNHPCVNMP
jgi:hypothetical protein